MRSARDFSVEADVRDHGIGLATYLRNIATDRAKLARDVRDHGIGLATYLRNIATDRAKLARKAKIRGESRRVAEQNRNDPEARESYDFWDRIA